MSSYAGSSLDEFGTTLKEWATITRSLESGRSAVLFRKGGLREKGFGVPSPRFFLFPTYVHQEKEKFRPEFHDLFEETAQEDPGPEKLVIRSMAEVVYSAKTSDPEKLPPLTCLTPLTEEELTKRYQWRSDQALHVLVVRTRLLETPFEIPMRKELGGCTSWVEIGPRGKVAYKNPSQSEEDLKEIRLKIQEVLSP